MTLRKYAVLQDRNTQYWRTGQEERTQEDMRTWHENTAWQVIKEIGTGQNVHSTPVRTRFKTEWKYANQKKEARAICCKNLLLISWAKQRRSLRLGWSRGHGQVTIVEEAPAEYPIYQWPSFRNKNKSRSTRRHSVAGSSSLETGLTQFYLHFQICFLINPK